MFPDGAELLLAQIKAQDSGSCTPPTVGREEEGRKLKDSLKSREQTKCVTLQIYFLIVKYENIFPLASANGFEPENHSILNSTSRTACPLGKITEKKKKREREYLHLGQAFLLARTH